jgi:hypothetical protein
MRTKQSRWIWLAQTFGLSAFLLVLGLGGLFVRYGSLTTAAAALQGDDLIIIPQLVDLGQVNPGSAVPFEISVCNESKNEVAILISGRANETFRFVVPLITTSQTSRPRIEIVGVCSQNLLPIPDSRP